MNGVLEILGCCRVFHKRPKSNFQAKGFQYLEISTYARTELNCNGQVINLSVDGF